MKGPPQIVAMGGGGFTMEPDNPLLDAYVLGLVESERPRVCFVPTASGDADSYVVRFYEAFASAAEIDVLRLFHRTVGDLDAFLLAQDIVYVGGGNTLNMLAVWKAHGLDAALRRAWEAGVVLTGLSAGAICWFEAGITDSFGGLDPLPGPLGMLPGSFVPHYDSEPARRPALLSKVAGGFPAGYAVEDGVALHFVGRDLSAVVSSRPRARAYRVERSGEGASETALVTRWLGDEEEAP